MTPRDPLAAAAGRPTGRELLRRHRRAVFLVASAAAAGLAVLWLVVVPEQAGAATGWRHAALRGGHPACWALLSLAAALHAFGAARRWVSATAWSALACYASFLLALAL